MRLPRVLTSLTAAVVAVVAFSGCSSDDGKARAGKTPAPAGSSAPAEDWTLRNVCPDFDPATHFEDDPAIQGADLNKAFGTTFTRTDLSNNNRCGWRALYNAPGGAYTIALSQEWYAQGALGWMNASEKKLPEVASASTPDVKTGKVLYDAATRNLYVYKEWPDSAYFGTLFRIAIGGNSVPADAEATLASLGKLALSRMKFTLSTATPSASK